MSIDDVMEFLVAHKAPNLPAKEVGIILDRLIWALNDNGDGICRVREQWLRGDDPEKVEIALAVENVFPFSDRREMEQVLSEIAGKWPHFRDRCHEIIAQRMKLRE